MPESIYCKNNCMNFLNIFYIAKSLRSALRNTAKINYFIIHKPCCLFNIFETTLLHQFSPTAAVFKTAAVYALRSLKNLGQVNFVLVYTNFDFINFYAIWELGYLRRILSITVFTRTNQR